MDDGLEEIPTDDVTRSVEYTLRRRAQLARSIQDELAPMILAADIVTHLP